MAPYIKELLDNLGNLSTHFKPILPCFSHKLGKSITPARTCSISGLKSRVLKFTFLSLKNDGKKWSRIYFEIHRAPSEIPAKLPDQFGHSGQIFLHWAAATLKGLGEFQNKKSRPLFTIIFK